MNDQKTEKEVIEDVKPKYQTPTLDKLSSENTRGGGFPTGVEATDGPS